MAWTTPRTWVAGEVVTAALGNVHWRDNLNALYGGAMSITSQAALDFIYATSATQLARLAKGTASQVLRMNSGATGYEFATLATPATPEGFFRGLHLRTSPNADVAATTVTLQHADAITLDDGTYVESWDDLSAVISSSGAGGLDTGSEGASRWYEIYAIRKSSDGTKNLLLHRAKNYLNDEEQTTRDNGTAAALATGTRTAIAQTFDTDVAGPIEIVDLRLEINASPTGRFWAEIRATSAGVPTGAALATSDKMDATLLPNSTPWVRFIFRSPLTVVAGTTYALVLTVDQTPSDTNYVAWGLNSAGGYAAGGQYRLQSGVWADFALGDDFTFKVYVTENDASVTMPSGYDQKCLVGYVYNDSGSNFYEFVAINRLVKFVDVLAPGVGNITATFMTLTDMSVFLPPLPVVVDVSGGNTNTTSSMIANGVPSGYGIQATANEDGGGVSIYTAGTNNTMMLGRVVTEYQAIYLRVGSGTGVPMFPAYEW